MNIEKTTIEEVLNVGKFIKKHAFNQGEVSWKSQDDPVTAIDIQAERMFIQNISKKLDAGFIGEELG